MQPGVALVKEDSKEDSDNRPQFLETVGGTIMLQLRPWLPMLKISKKKKREKECPKVDLQLEDKDANGGASVAKNETFIELLGFVKDKKKTNVQ